MSKEFLGNHQVKLIQQMMYQPIYSKVANNDINSTPLKRMTLMCIKRS